MRRLIICCDGTWNHPDQKGRNDGPRKPSNIVKIARSINPVDAHGVSQIVYYEKGVGTGNALDKITGGVQGDGLDQNIVSAYRFLVNNYAAGDEIYIFGFSRGAYTARSLTGFIQFAGLLTKFHTYFTPEAFAMYQNKDDDISFFRENHQARDIKIKFIGVFDTVGAMGIPLKLFSNHNIKKYSFHDTRLGENIENAYQALAIDEKRKPFAPTLWNDDILPTQTMEQRWFAGVHTNIGGGYEKDGLANIPLHWILHHAQQTGLEINYDYIKHYKPYFGHKLYKSSNLMYRMLGMGSNIRKISLAKNQTIDKSVQIRMDKDKSYHPKNIKTSSIFSDSLRVNKPTTEEN